MNHHNGRPLTMRKKVQLLVALTILAWATQTLLAQWAHGQDAAAQPAAEPAAPVEPAAAFVPRDVRIGAATLELRSEVRVYGGSVRLKQICRWSADDAPTFAP